MFPGVRVMGDKLGKNVSEEINTILEQIKDKFQNSILGKLKTLFCSLFS